MSKQCIPELPVSKVIKELATIYTPLIRNHLGYSGIPSPFLWGPPGVGKSDGIKELAEILEAKTGKKVVVTDIRLLLFSPIDLRGVPVADSTKQFTDWLKPRILDLDASDKIVNILFLDELSAAPQSVQAAAYQLTLNRAIGEHKLPENTLVCAAGNRVNDRAVAYKMPSALANRMMHFEVSVDFDSWSHWAIEKGNVHPFVLGYLSYARDKLYVEELNGEDVAFPSPRSWMFVSNILNTLGEIDNLDDYYALISSCIGMGYAIEFIGWSKVYSILPKMEDIFDGKVTSCPSSPDVLSALIASMTSFTVNKNKTGELLDGEMENACRFCATLPTEYAALYFLNIMPIEAIRLKLMKSANFMAWQKMHRKALIWKTEGFS